MDVGGLLLAMGSGPGIRCKQHDGILEGENSKLEL